MGFNSGFKGLKFIISGRNSHCDYSHRALENLPTAL